MARDHDVVLLAVALTMLDMQGVAFIEGTLSLLALFVKAAPMVAPCRFILATQRWRVTVGNTVG